MIGWLRNRLLGWADRLRFPRLLMLTAALFVVDLAIPDLVPFIDEILLALATLILSRIRRLPASRQASNGKSGLSPHDDR